MNSLIPSLSSAQFTSLIYAYIAALGLLVALLTGAILVSNTEAFETISVPLATLLIVGALGITIRAGQKAFD